MANKALRTPEDRFANLPHWGFQPRYITDLNGFKGLRLHYVDEGPRDAQVTFLCLHGEPSWAYLYRKMLTVFRAKGHRVVAPDFYGFGRSDKPVDDTIYTFNFHRKTLVEFIRHLKLKNVCLVIQDWGGILGLTLPMTFPQEITRMIVMNTFLPVGEGATEGFEAWKAYVAGNPDLNVGGLMGRAAPNLDEHEIRAYDAPFPTQDHKAGVRRFPELVMVKPGMEGIDTAKDARRFLSNDWSGQTFMAVGMQDPVLGPDVMAMTRDLIRNAPAPMEVPAGGHFVQEEGTPIARAALEAFRL